jgi:hypothetical protein
MKKSHRLIARLRRLPVFATPLSGFFAAPFSMLCAALIVVSLTGCFADERVAGGDDFPNSIETLGKEGTAASTDSADWNAYEESPSTPPEVYDSAFVPDSAPEEGASAPAKVAVAPEGRVAPGLEIAGAVRSLISLSDPVTGLFRAIRVQTLVGIEARDTTWYRLQGILLTKRVVRMSGVVTYDAGRTERFSFEDADGDSILTPRAGFANLARVRFLVTYATGRVEERNFTIAAGSDLAFGTRADNVLRSLQTVHRIGNDTVYRLSLRPVGTDSIVFDPSRDSGRVDVEQMVSADGVRSTLTYRTVLFADSNRNRATRFHRTVETSSGVTETIALGKDSTLDFAPGDTGRVQIRFASTNVSDTLAEFLAEYRVVLSDTAGRFAGNRLMQIDREKTFRYGTASASRYRLTPISPIPNGGSTRTGSIQVRVDLRSGGWVELDGSATSDGILGIWEDSTGKSGTVRFGALGAIVPPTEP